MSNFRKVLQITGIQDKMLQMYIIYMHYKFICYIVKLQYQFRACSFDPGKPLSEISPHTYFPKFRCVHARSQAGPLAEISARGMKITHMNFPLVGKKNFEMRVRRKNYVIDFQTFK